MSAYDYASAYRGVIDRKLTGEGTAVTQVTQDAAHVTIAVPAGKGGRLVEVQVQAKGTPETIVVSGGHVALRNSSEDWAPFEFFIGGNTCITSGATNVKPYRFSCSKYLPGNSSVYVDYTPIDNQSQFLAVTLCYELAVNPYIGSYRETFSKTTPYANYKFASAVTSVARTNWGQVVIPGHKGGVSYAVGTITYQTLTTGVVPLAVEAEFEADSHDTIPTKFFGNTVQVLTTGAAEVEPCMQPHRDKVPANSNWTLYGTANDATSAHTLGGLIAWERPFNWQKVPTPSRA